MNSTKVSTGIRLASMVLDHVFICIIMGIFSLPLMIPVFSSAFNVSPEPAEAFTGTISSKLLYIMDAVFVIYFCKDSFNGRSLAKRILKLQVVNNATGEAASPVRCFVRNIFIILWPVEGIVALANPPRRIGDFVAGTKVVYFEPAAQQKPNYIQILMAFLLACSLLLLATMPLNNYLTSRPNDSSVVLSSYNETESKGLSNLLADSLGQYARPDVRVYDTTNKAGVKYVSVVLYLRRNYAEDEIFFQDFQQHAMALLSSNFSLNTCTGKIQYVYKAPGQVHINSREF